MSFYGSQDPLPLFPYSSVNSFFQNEKVLKIALFSPIDGMQ